jgi:hypothetical protein
MTKKEASYRAWVWALIFDDAYNFLMVKLQWEIRDRWDFVKWWAYFDETWEETIKREIKEELWNDFKVEIIQKSSWYFMYEWPLKLQETKWFKGQIRQNYWVKYISEI